MQHPRQDNTPEGSPPLEKSGFGIPPALRYPAYRAYWFGLLASVSGFQMFRVAQFWLTYEITGSVLSLGLVGAANAIPAIFFNLFGGVFADRLDKRRLIMGTQIATSSPNQYDVRFENGAWRCECHFFATRDICSHTMALQRMLDEMMSEQPEPAPAS